MATQQAAPSRRRTADRSVGMFIVEEDIGKGSFAIVYRGRHKVRHGQMPMERER
jgi:serine/threonine-protein kinase ULK/ATG1